MHAEFVALKTLIFFLLKLSALMHGGVYAISLIP